MTEIDAKASRLPKGLKNFVNQSLDLLEYNQFLDAFKEKYNILDGYCFHWALICWFLGLQIEFDRNKVSTEYKETKYVYQLPEKDIQDCLFYMNYILGTTVHTGGHDYVKMFQLYKKNLFGLSSSSDSRTLQKVDCAK